MEIRGAVAVVTGASSGIGRATALALSRRGARVVLASRRKNLLEEVAAEAGRLGAPSALVVPTDVCDPDSIDELAAQVFSEFGACSILVNNAGAPAYGPVEELSREQIEHAVRLNLL